MQPINRLDQEMRRRASASFDAREIHREDMAVTEIFEAGTRSSYSAAELVRWCAWRNCDNGFQGEMPAGWTWLITYWAPWPDATRTIADVVTDQFCKRDAAICPRHSAELEALLRDIGGRLRETAGSA